MFEFTLPPGLQANSSTSSQRPRRGIGRAGAGQVSKSYQEQLLSLLGDDARSILQTFHEVRPTELSDTFGDDDDDSLYLCGQQVKSDTRLIGQMMTDANGTPTTYLENGADLEATKWWNTPRFGFKTSAVEHKDIDSKWERAFSSIQSPSSNQASVEMVVGDLKRRSLFIPNIDLHTLPSAASRYLENVSREVEGVIHAKARPRSREEKKWDRNALPWNIGGFGSHASQLYIKSGLSVTKLHDEIGMSSAANYMFKRSSGVALWIGLNLVELNEHMSKEDIQDLMDSSDCADLLGRLYQLRKLPLSPPLHVSFCWQTPGTIVYSPPSNGSAHIVVTVGSYVEQLAFNHSFTPNGIRQCLDFWQDSPSVEFNCGRATERVLPLLWMESRGLSVGRGALYAQLRNILRAKELASQPKIYVALEKHNSTVYWCDACINPALYVLCSGICERCLLGMPRFENEWNTEKD